MDDELFEELVVSIKQGGNILRSSTKAKGILDSGNPDVKTIRANYGLSQSKFAKLLGISPGTLRNWEQGRRKPDGPARVLLCVAAKHPQAILDTLYSAGK